MSSDILYTYPGNFRAQKIEIAAKLSHHSLTVHSSAPNFVFGETNKSEDFLKKFPLGKVPALTTSAGFHLFESNAIAYYVSSQELRGNDTESQSLIQQWINFADFEILPSVCKWVYPTLGITQFHKPDNDAAKEHLQRCLAYLNSHFLNKTYLVGERISLADITLFCDLMMAYQSVFEPSFRNEFVNVNRWFSTLLNNPVFVSVIGDKFEFCSKTAQPDGKKFAELHGGQKRDSHRRDSHKKKHGKKSPSVEKEEKHVEVEEKAAEEIPTEKTEKPIVPRNVEKEIIALECGTFDFDAFKRAFSNEDTKTVAIPLLWETFDPNYFSIWKMDYKYNDELEQIFMSSNLMKGMLQRIDNLRKIAFAVSFVFGVDNKNNIEGLWIMKGTELLFPLDEDWNVDAEHYEFTRLDSTKDSDRAIVESYLLQESVRGYEFPDNKSSYVEFK